MKQEILSFLLVVALLLGCMNDEKETIHTDNSNFNVQLLFEVDSTRVYRFFDGGRARYFTTSKGSVSWTEKSSKTTNYVEIPTN